jgi:hypothetical protein
MKLHSFIFIFCTTLILQTARADDDHEESDEELMQSSISTSVSGGNNDYTQFGFTGEIAVYFSNAQLNNELIEKQFGFEPFWQINENHALRFDISLGQQEKGVGSRTVGLGYNYILPSHFKTDVALKLSGTIYTLNGAQASPKEHRIDFTVSHEFKSNINLGINISLTNYTAQALQTYRQSLEDEDSADVEESDEESEEEEDDEDIFISNPPERTVSAFVNYSLNEKNTFNFEVGVTTPIVSGDRSSFYNFSWAHNWNEHWSTGLNVSRTRVLAETQQSYGLSLGYVF